MAIYVPPSLRGINKKADNRIAYTVHIYERKPEFEMRVYDVEIFLSNTRPNPGPDRKLVYSCSKTSTVIAGLKQLTYYMHWKFGGTGARLETCNNTHSFKEVANDLEWIVSIVKVELDYHIGDKKCLLPKNKEKLREYSRSRLSGYGKKFCDENRISQSRLARIMCSPVRAMRL
jgi:hypothetical protein